MSGRKNNNAIMGSHNNSKMAPAIAKWYTSVVQATYQNTAANILRSKTILLVFVLWKGEGAFVMIYFLFTLKQTSFLVAHMKLMIEMLLPLLVN